VEVDAAEIVSDEFVDLPKVDLPKIHSTAKSVVDTSKTKLTEPELRQLLTSAGAEHDLDVDLLACIVRQESGGNARAVSRAGARG